METICELSGNSDMYGLGIRIGSYLQWLSLLIAARYVPSELPGLRTSNAFFTSATFIGLVVETALQDIEITEIYITMLLVFGSQYIWLTAMLWRVFTPSEPESSKSSLMHWFSFGLVQVAQIGFQLWFWIFKVAKFARRENTCQRFGFGFYKFGLTSDGFRIFNILLKAALLVLTVVLFALYARHLSKAKSKKEENREYDSPNVLWDCANWLHSHTPKQWKKDFFMAFQIASITIVILAIELTISWNRIQDVDCAKTIGQFIPLAISVAGVIQLLLQFLPAEYRANRCLEVDRALQQGANIYAKLVTSIVRRPTQDDDEVQSTAEQASEKGPQVTIISSTEDV